MEHILWLAIGLLLILEGLMPALLPDQWQQFLLKLSQTPVNQIRTMGVVMIIVGAVIIKLFSH
jgi:hypothetical protein